MLSRSEIDSIVYQCRQAGDDSTYAIVNKAIDHFLASAPPGAGQGPREHPAWPGPNYSRADVLAICKDHPMHIADHVERLYRALGPGVQT